jgi:SRSO17 transposase
MLGKQDDGQVATSISLASKQGRLPAARQLYLLRDWAADPERRAKAGVPKEVRFSTKTQIARQRLRALLDEGADGMRIRLLDGGNSEPRI